jgi:hypothetical protein
MGKGYGRYWLIAIAVGLPVIAFGVWRLIDRSQGLSYDEATQLWIRAAATGAILLAATLVLLAAIALPYVLALRRARMEHPHASHFLARRSSHLAKALDEALENRGGKTAAWTYWILTDASDSGFRFRERPNSPDSGLSFACRRLPASSWGRPKPMACRYQL